MVTVGVLVLVIVSLLQAFVYFSNLANAADNLSLAISKSQSMLEEMRNHPFGNITADFSSGGTPGNKFQLLKSNGDGVDMTGVVYVTPINADLLQAKVVVCWRNKDGRIVGSDNGGGDASKALNGVPDSGEAVDGDGHLTSPVTVMSYIAKR